MYYCIYVCKYLYVCMCMCVCVQWILFPLYSVSDCWGLAQRRIWHRRGHRPQLLLPVSENRMAHYSRVFAVEANFAATADYILQNLQISRNLRGICFYYINILSFAICPMIPRGSVPDGIQCRHGGNGGAGDRSRLSECRGGDAGKVPQQTKNQNKEVLATANCQKVAK